VCKIRFCPSPLTPHPHQIPRSRMSGAIPLLAQYDLMAWCLVKRSDNFTFTLPYLTLPYPLVEAEPSVARGTIRYSCTQGFLRLASTVFVSPFRTLAADDPSLCSPHLRTLFFAVYTRIVPKVMSTFILQRNEGIHTKTNYVSKI
jgi:hypothetical protein